MSSKPPVSVMQPPPAKSNGPDANSDFGAQWSEARLAYPLYAALAVQFELAPLPHPAGEMPPARPTRAVFDNDLRWLAEIDHQVRAFQIRQLPSEILNSNEQALRAFIQRQLKKPDKTNADRDKIDLLLVQYFALCAPEDLYRKEIKLEDVARVLKPALPQADATPLEWCQPLENILASLEHCHSLRDLMEHGLLEQGRLVKESAGAMFYDPAALVAFVRFNFVLRRAFIRLLHADLSAVSHAVDALEAAGVKAVDCRRAGFSAAETTVQLRYYSENWRQPFHKDYTSSSVTHAFEKLLALRADLEEALGRARPPSAAAPSSAEMRKQVAPPEATESETPASPIPAAPRAAAVQVTPPVAPGPKNAEARTAVPPATKSPAVSAPPPASSTPASPDLAAPVAAMDADSCLEAVWEQLIAAPPSRGRSMSTVVLQNTKVLLSSWEVAAFIAEGDQEAEDLRRAVVARALLAVAMDERKRSGESDALASALTLARSEVSYFQSRVEQAKRAKNTEAAVNLGISTKRLLSFMEEAEKLQP
jgi:hypothetical protein